MDKVGKLAPDVEDPPRTGVEPVPSADDVVPTTAPEVLLPREREDVLSATEEVEEEDGASTTTVTLALFNTLKIWR